MDLLSMKKFVWTWVLPMLSIFGISSNAINIFVLSVNKTKTKNRLHTYLRIDSIVEFCYLIIVFVHFVLKIINPQDNYYTVLYEKYLYNYVASSLAFFMLFIKLFITIKRLLITGNHRIRCKAFKLKSLLAFFFFFSFLFDIPMLIGLSIQFKSEDTRHHGNVSLNSFYLSYRMSQTPNEIKTLYYLSASFRGLVAPIMLLIFNMIFLRKLSQRIKFVKEIMKETPRKITSDFNHKSKKIIFIKRRAKILARWWTESILIFCGLRLICAKELNDPLQRSKTFARYIL